MTEWFDFKPLYVSSISYCGLESVNCLWWRATDALETAPTLTPLISPIRNFILMSHRGQHIGKAIYYESIMWPIARPPSVLGSPSSESCRKAISHVVGNSCQVSTPVSQLPFLDSMHLHAFCSLGALLVSLLSLPLTKTVELKEQKPLFPGPSIIDTTFPGHGYIFLKLKIF